MSGYKIFSSGGVGDALIVGTKLKDIVRQNKNIKEWWNFEKHVCHCKPTKEIMNLFESAYNMEFTSCCLVPTPEKAAKGMVNCLKNSIYLDTKIINVKIPYLDNREVFNRENTSYGIGPIVINMTAGRLNDNTRREIGFDLINQLHTNFDDRNIVLIGPERVNMDLHYPYNQARILNQTGKTENIQQALEIINSCSLFVGQDGVLSYWAAMKRKPTIIYYHIPTLLNHYWNNKWTHHVVPIIGAGNKANELPNNDHVEKILSLARRYGD